MTPGCHSPAGELARPPMGNSAKRKSGGELLPAVAAEPAALIVVAGADAGGCGADDVLRGDEAVVAERRQAMRRRTAAILAQLNKVQPLPRTTAAVDGETLARDREAVQASRGLALKTAGKVSTDERSFDLYVEEQGLQLEEESFPPEHVMVEFAAWLTRHRERVCLAQRDGSGPRLTGLVRTTIRNMITELFAHAWPRRFSAWVALPKPDKVVYESNVLDQLDGLHKVAAQETLLILC